MITMSASIARELKQRPLRYSVGLFFILLIAWNVPSSNNNHGRISLLMTQSSRDPATQDHCSAKVWCKTAQDLHHQLPIQTLLETHEKLINSAEFKLENFVLSANATSWFLAALQAEGRGEMDTAVHLYHTAVELSTQNSLGPLGWQAAYRGRVILFRSQTQEVAKWCRFCAGKLLLHMPRLSKEWKAIQCDANAYLPPSLLYPELHCSRGELVHPGRCRCWPGFTGEQCDQKIRPSSRLPNVCLITREFADLSLGGIGTAFTQLSKFLSAGGYPVTVLWLGTEHPGIERTSRRFAKDYKIKIYTLPSQNKVRGPAPLLRAYLAYLWLIEHERECDIVHFHEWSGPGYFMTQAKHHGLRFQKIIFIAQVHGPWIWALHNQKQLLDGQSLEMSFAEVKSLELADKVISCSQYILGYLREELGARIAPERSVVIPNVQLNTDGSVIESLPTQNARLVQVNEIVFFGKTDFFKGIDIFCDAIDRLVSDGDLHFRVTFLVRFKQVSRDGQDGKDYVEMRSVPWKRAGIIVTVESNRDSDGCVEFLKENQRIAVMPSVLENSPYVVVECMTHQIPFIATAVGGTHELVHPDDVHKVLIPQGVHALTNKLREAIAHGGWTARMQFSFETVYHRWNQLHNVKSSNLNLRGDYDGCSLQGDPVPLVSIIIPTFNRPQELKEVIQTCLDQDYPTIEIVVVDDASTDSAHLTLLDALPSLTQLPDRSVRVVRNSENRYLGYSRNHGVAVASGELILFADDDDPLLPNAVSTLTKTLCFSGSDAVGARPWYYPAGKERNVDASYVVDWVILGGSLTIGTIKNSFSGPTMLIRKESFHVVGNYTETRAGCEDWEYWIRMWLIGLEPQKALDPLYWYREGHSSSMFHTMSKYDCSSRILRPLSRSMPKGLEFLPEFAHTLARVAPPEYT